MKPKNRNHPNLKHLKIAASLVFVFIVAFFVVRGCMPRPTIPVKKEPVVRVVKKAPIKPVAKPVKKKVAVPPATKSEGKGKLAIVLDDWGNSSARIQAAIDINRPITLAILPRLPHSREVAQAAKNNRMGVMLHLPMEPQSKSQPLEPKTILTTTSDATIKKYIDEALQNVSLVEGVNNHQGSQATSDARVVKTVLTHIHSKGLFFVDSYVSSKSVVAPIAEDLGIPFAKRDVFIDNESDVEGIKDELREAKRIALAHGHAIAIGHDRKNTLIAIKEIVNEFEEDGIEFVLVKELLH